MDNIDISFGDDVLLGHGNGVTIDDYNDNVISSETVVGPQGPPGPPGYSPIANVTQTQDGAIVRITDETGTTSANIYNGNNGISPNATVTQTASGATISITDANGTTTATVNNGEDGDPGDNATISIGQVTTLAPGTQATVSNVGTATNAVLDFGIPEGIQGEQGIQGTPGINAQAYVTQNTGSATITIEDADGTTTATVYDGQDGTNGTDGFSPIATVTQNTGSATISITDINGTTTATVYDGTPGSVPNDGTLTIQKNGTTVQTFTANQSTNTTANITVPTATSELTNDSGYITSANIPTKTSNLTNDGDDGTHPFLATDDVATVATSGSYNDLTNKPTIPPSQVNSDWNANSGVAEILNKPTISNFNYSYSEQDTGTTWVDGKKIYSKTYYFASLASYGVVTQPLPTGYSDTVKIEGLMRQGGSSWALPYPNCYFDTTWGNLEVANPNYDFTAMNAIVTLYYTK